MQSSNRFAFKEWAVICEALGEGRQSVIVRKGGIHEGQAGFRVEHREFWLFPTYVHQAQSDSLIPEAQPLLARVLRDSPAEEWVGVSLYVEVAEVYEILRQDCLTGREGLQILSRPALDERFHYRRPGLFVMAARVYRLDSPNWLTNSPHFAGCKSWVEFPQELPTSQAEPVLTDAEFESRLTGLAAALEPPSWA